jgi:hypothetical protein
MKAKLRRHISRENEQLAGQPSPSFRQLADKCLPFVEDPNVQRLVRSWSRKQERN